MLKLLCTGSKHFDKEMGVCVFAWGEQCRDMEEGRRADDGGQGAEGGIRMGWRHYRRRGQQRMTKSRGRGKRERGGSGRCGRRLDVV
jgi:hypothetical protein